MHGHLPSHSVTSRRPATPAHRRQHRLQASDFGCGPVQEDGLGDPEGARGPEEGVPGEGRQCRLHDAEQAAARHEARDCREPRARVRTERSLEARPAAVAEGGELLGEEVCVLHRLVGALPQEGRHGVRRVPDEHRPPAQAHPGHERVVCVAPQLKAALALLGERLQVGGEPCGAQAGGHGPAHVCRVPVRVHAPRLRARLALRGVHDHTLVEARAACPTVSGLEAVRPRAKPLVQLARGPRAGAARGDAPLDADARVKGAQAPALLRQHRPPGLGADAISPYHEVKLLAAARGK
mmetsp:Transcript_15551/g.52502  ORF Transcript_15551/g.52502 Transcript_15551/m.52502 type:complete len:295 (+) Transcript_15551:43-927(+)